MNLKKCSCCKNELSLELFSKNKRSSDGLKGYCKKCASIKGKLYRESNREKVLKSKRDWYEKTKSIRDIRTSKEIEKGFRVCTCCNIKKSIDNFYMRGNGGFYGECKECQLKKQNDYRLRNIDKITLRKKEYNKKNKDKISEYNNRYYKLNSKDITERVKKWKIDNVEKAKALSVRGYHKRKAMKDNLKSDYTKSQWRYCKEYFNHECAYYGRKMSRLTQDHFIPVSKYGGYTKDNIIPSCGSCNSSKFNYDFEEWYSSKNFYSEERKHKIYKYLNSMK